MINHGLGRVCKVVGALVAVEVLQTTSCGFYFEWAVGSRVIISDRYLYAKPNAFSL